MLKLEEVTAIINEHVQDEEAKANIGVALLEKDLPESTNEEMDKLKAELDAERAAREADKASYIERINRFIYGGDPGTDKPSETTTDEEVVEEKSFYERYVED